MAYGITQVAALRLAKPSSKQELEEDEVHIQALQLARSEPGYADIAWDVLQEDPTILIWISKRDSFIAETQGVRQTGLHYPYVQYLSALLTTDPVILINHFDYNPHPIDWANSRAAYCLELFGVILKPGKQILDIKEAFTPITDVWDKTNRAHMVSHAIEPEDESLVLYIVFWNSIEEHIAATKEEYFEQGVKNVDEVIGKVALYGHIHPLEKEED